VINLKHEADEATVWIESIIDHLALVDKFTSAQVTDCNQLNWMLLAPLIALGTDPV
jgi:hypothetical protein